MDTLPVFPAQSRDTADTAKVGVFTGKTTAYNPWPAVCFKKNNCKKNTDTTREYLYLQYA